ncbi:hypothetical protein [Halomarina rubra]|uniref:Uncharacterized protein n=1 Tax=Halomarina rubra TaxID=2071873 RepID=A0ABD6B1E5_9EURY|nr:hypothetical protein [Halomarina rubra]
MNPNTNGHSTKTAPTTQKAAKPAPSTGSMKMRPPARRKNELQTAEFLEALTATGVDMQTAQAVQNLLSQDFLLGRVKDADREEAKYLARNIVRYVECDHPPEDSMLQGTLRRALLGDIDDGKKALTQRQKTQLESTLMAFFFRSSRSVDGWQQDKIADQVSVRKTEAGGQNNDGGLFGGLFS